MSMTIDKLGLSTRAIQLVTEQPRLWEYRLFAQVIIDEVETVKRLFQRGHRAQGEITDKVDTLPHLGDWMGKKNNEILVILNELISLVNSNHDDVFGLPGISGNVEGIVEYSRKIVVFYYQAIAWSQIVQNTPMALQFEEIRQEFNAISVGIPKGIEQMGFTILSEIDDAINAPSTGKPRTLTLGLDVEISSDRVISALERLTKKIEDSGLSPDKFETFENDYKLKHLILKNIQFWDSENEELHPATLELFGHCFEARIHTRRKPIRSVSSPGAELKHTATQMKQRQDFLVALGSAENMFVLSRQNLELLEQHYQEINKDVLALREHFRDTVNALVSHLLSDKELMEMGKNFIDSQPIAFYTDVDCLIFIEFIIEEIHTPLGNLLLLYPKEARDFYVKKNSEFMENNDLDDIKSYLSDGLAMFTKVLKERNPEVEIYAAYTFVYNIAIEHLAQKWKKGYKQYFEDIDELDLDKAIERYCSIETINHQDFTLAGIFIYYLIKEGKFERGNRNYFDCLGFFSKKLDKIMNDNKYKNFVGRLKTSSSHKKHTIDDVDLMSGQEFENFIAELFSKMGYETEITKATGDQGIDVIVSKNGSKIGIQVKCYSGTVGNSAIQEAVAGKNYYHLDKAMVITNNFFTDSARQLARANSIVLWDRNTLKEKI